MKSSNIRSGSWLGLSGLFLLTLMNVAALGAEPAGKASGTTAKDPRSLDGTVLNVKDKQFGAVGDGITNDAPAINKALELSRKTGEFGEGVKGTTIYIPPGIYRLDSPLDLNGRQFNIVGAGSYQTVLR